jgi:hypothetical protein
MYKIDVESEQIFILINHSGIDFAKLDTDKRSNLCAIAHIYVSTNQSIPFNDFVFDMMTDGINEDMGVPLFVLEEVTKTNGKIYYDRQVFNIVKHLLNVYEKKELARLLYYQPHDNRLFDLIKSRAIFEHSISTVNAIKLATEICRFSISELAIFNSSLQLNELYNSTP